MAKRRRSKARRHRTPPRNAKGRFVKRGKARVHARRARPAARRAQRRHRRGGSTLRRHYSPKYVVRARKRRTKTGKHLRAVARIPRHGRVAGLVRLNPREFAAITGNPRRRRRRRNPAAMLNPRRRRRHYRRNPRGFSMPSMSSMLPIVAGGVGGGVLAGALDSSFLAEKSELLKAGAKAAVAIASEALLRRRAPRVATGITGGIMGSVGYSLAVSMGGGVVADNKRHALKKVAAQGLGDPEMAAMLGDVVDANVLSDIANGEYDEHLSDVVEA